VTVDEAVTACDFWTTNVAETKAIGSSTDPEIAAAFNCTISHPRDIRQNPDGPRNYDIRVPRWLTKTDDITGEIVRSEDGLPMRVESSAYILIVAEIERRKNG